MFDFATQQKEWLLIPIDDSGYHSATDLMKHDDQTLKNMADDMQQRRYYGWRNEGNKWRETLGLDDTHGKKVLDFGCGFGIEALQFLKAGNEVTIADINVDTLMLAKRVLGIYGYDVKTLLIENDYPFVDTKQKFDIFYSNGVLHHTPKAGEICERAFELLKDGGEIRLMLYSDKGKEFTDSIGQDFVRYFDSVGFYADWYNEDKLRRLARGFFKFSYITKDNRYLTVIYKK